MEVEFKGGSAHATHEYHVDPNYTPDKAFILGHFGGWYMGAPAPFPATVSTLLVTDKRAIWAIALFTSAAHSTYILRRALFACSV